MERQNNSSKHVPEDVNQVATSSIVALHPNSSFNFIMPCSDATEQLKGEGNALFVENDFAGAYNKYTQALRHDDKNASLYCNRAACSLGLDRCVGLIQVLHPA